MFRAIVSSGKMEVGLKMITPYMFRADDRSGVIDSNPTEATLFSSGYCLHQFAPRNMLLHADYIRIGYKFAKFIIE